MKKEGVEWLEEGVGLKKEGVEWLKGSDNECHTHHTGYQRDGCDSDIRWEQKSFFCIVVFHAELGGVAALAVAEKAEEVGWFFIYGIKLSEQHKVLQIESKSLKPPDDETDYFAAPHDRDDGPLLTDHAGPSRQIPV